MLEDCFKYYKECQACQRFRKIQIVPASAMISIIKPWPFRGWGMDMIGKINPPSSKGHQFILAIIDYSKNTLFIGLGFLRLLQQMEGRYLYLMSSKSSLPTWGSN
jgi:hypothetical protein